jgi:hypothetical protein
VINKIQKSQTLVADICNPSYSGGKYQVDCGFEAIPIKIVFKTLPLKYPTQNRAGRVA